MTAKLFAAVEHQRLLERAVEAMAEAGTVTGPDGALHPLQRAYLLSRAETIYGGSAQVQRNLIAERLLGMPREPRPAWARAMSRRCRRAGNGSYWRLRNAAELLGLGHAGQILTSTDRTERSPFEAPTSARREPRGE